MSDQGPTTGSGEGEKHDPTGLGLAQSIARSVEARGRRRGRTARRDRVDPQSSGARPDARDPQLLSEAVDRMRALGVEVEGVVGDANPVQAVDDLLRSHPHDEIVLSTLPAGVSRWLKLDVQHRIEQRFQLPVTTVTSTRHPVS